MEFKSITEIYFDRVIFHLRNSFFADEPLNKAAGLCRGGMGNRELEHHSRETLADNLSIMAIDKQGEIAGVILNGVLRAGDTEQALKNLQLSRDENFKKIFELLYVHNLRVNIFELFDVAQCFDIRILSVDSRYRGQGIAKQLVARSEQLARERGFEIMKADATGILSQKILQANGFQVLNEQLYRKYTDDYGKPILTVEAPHLKLQLLYKRLLPTPPPRSPDEDERYVEGEELHIAENEDTSP